MPILLLPGFPASDAGAAEFFLDPNRELTRALTPTEPSCSEKKTSNPMSACEALGGAENLAHAKARYFKTLDHLAAAELETLRGLNIKIEQERRKIAPELTADFLKPEVFQKVLELHPAYGDLLDESQKNLERLENRFYEAATQVAGAAHTAPEPDSIEIRAMGLKAALVNEIAAETSFPSPIRAQLVQRLSKADIITARSIRGIRDPLERAITADLFTHACGNDLKSINAIAVMDWPALEVLDRKAGEPELKPRFFICPGILASVAPLGLDESALDFILAHEISHFVTMKLPRKSAPADSKPFPLGQDRGLIEVHRKLLSCQESQAGEDLREFPEAIRLLESDVNTPTTAGSRALLKVVRGLNWEFERALGRPATRGESHSMELIADYWATRILAPKIRETRPRNRDEVVARNFALFCMGAADTFPTLPDGDEGMHPSNHLRIENFLSHPSLRDLPGGVSRPWCEH